MSSSINYVDYSDRSFCVRADRDRFGRNLKNLKGKWHSNIDGSPGWLVPKASERELRQLIQNSQEIDRMTVSSTRKDPRYHRADSDDDRGNSAPMEDEEEEVFDDDLDPIVKSLLDGNRQILNDTVQDSTLTTASRASRVSNVSRASKPVEPVEPVERIRRPSPKKDRVSGTQSRDIQDYARYGESTRDYRKRFGQRTVSRDEEEDEEERVPERKKKYYSSSEEEESEDDFPMPDTPKEDPRIGQIDAMMDELTELTRRVRRLEKQVAARR